jgi:hypothetical protein
MLFPLVALITFNNDIAAGGENASPLKPEDDLCASFVFLQKRGKCSASS